MHCCIANKRLGAGKATISGAEQGTKYGINRMTVVLSNRLLLEWTIGTTYLYKFTILKRTSRLFWFDAL